MLSVDNHLEDPFRIPGISFGILSFIAPPNHEAEEGGRGNSRLHHAVPFLNATSN